MSYAALPHLRTPRLTLRPLEKTDADAVVDGIGNYDVSRWLGRVPYPYGPQDYDEFFARVTDQNLMIWGILCGDDLIGAVGLDEELGYWLARPHWGQGYAFEAAIAAVSHWFSDPRRGDLVSGHYDDNHRSRRLLQALGFRAVGQSPRYAKSLAQEVSGTDVVLTRAGWEARQNFVLTTPRLTIRPIEDRDAAGFAALMVPEVARMLSSVTPGMSEAEALADIPRRKWRGYPGFTQIIEHDARVAGAIGFGKGTLGYYLAPDLWGQGLVSEALAAFLPEVFDRFPLDSIKADHFEDNPASGAILRKFGFRQTGRDMGTSKARLEPQPLITYALSRDNFKVPL